MGTISLCKGDKVKLLRCGANDRERVAKVLYANDYEFIPLTKLFGFIPWFVVRKMGVWEVKDEGVTWVKINTEGACSAK